MGKIEPTDEEAKSIYDDENEVPEPENAQEEEQVVGIPEFWGTVLRNSPEICEMITEQDDQVLAKLENITLHYMDDNAVGN